ncbi:MAG: tyrosine-type recombinase/integrase [Anaerolineae bacterium]|jgi:integrase/recombinase XerD
MQKEIDKFLKYLKERKKYSDNTIAAYRNDLSQFSKYLLSCNVRDWRRLSKQDLIGFETHMRVEQEYLQSTIARKLASIRSFCHFLTEFGVISQDPAEGLDSPPVARRTPRTLSEPEMTALLELPGRSQTPKGQRDRAILELLYATGMRVSELTALDISDVDLRAGLVNCGSRAATRREVPVSRAAKEALATYIKHGRTKLLVNQDEPALFLNHRGERLSRQGLWLVIKGYAEQLDLDGRITPHTLRHSAAANKLRGGANLSEIQQLLGHASATSTQVYARIARGLRQREVSGK